MTDRPRYVITYDPAQLAIPHDAHCSMCDSDVPPDCIVEREPGHYKWYAHDSCMASILVDILNLMPDDPARWDEDARKLRGDWPI